MQSTGFDLNSKITTIGENAYSYCKSFIVLNIPASVTKIGASAFQGCEGMLSVIFHENNKLEHIENSTFKDSSINGSIALPSTLKSIGNYAFAACNSCSTVNIHKGLTAIGVGAFEGCSGLTIYTEYSSAQTGWLSGWNSTKRPVVWNCVFSKDPFTYVSSIIKSNKNPEYGDGSGSFNEPTRLSYELNGWYTTSDFSGTQYATIKAAPNGTLFAKWTEKDSCISEGSLITLADGSQVAVEDLKGDEELLVWNLFTGKFDKAPIVFIDSEEPSLNAITRLSFSDGTQVKVIGEHAFWDCNLNEYVYLRSDAAKYVGHWFNKQTYDTNGNMIWTKVQLTGVENYEEFTTAYSPVTYSHLCYYVNGMLTIPGGIEGLFNIFNVDASTMQIDKTAFDNDIQTYGIYTYEEFAEIVPITRTVFEAFNGQYLKVAVGKGLLSINDIIELVNRYEVMFPKE